MVPPSRPGRRRWPSYVRRVASEASTSEVLVPLLALERTNNQGRYRALGRDDAARCRLMIRWPQPIAPVDNAHSAGGLCPTGPLDEILMSLGVDCLAADR
jgi:hypothetical protein